MGLFDSDLCKDDRRRQIFSSIRKQEYLQDKVSVFALKTVIIYLFVYIQMTDCAFNISFVIAGLWCCERYQTCRYEPKKSLEMKCNGVKRLTQLNDKNNVCSYYFHIKRVKAV